MRLRGGSLLSIGLSACMVVLAGGLQAQQPPSVQQALAGLADQPSTHTGFTFDKAMLAQAGSLIDPGMGDARQVAAALNSITVDTYRFQQPAFYSPEAMAALIASYNAMGWKHLVNAHASPAESAQPMGAMTDMWLHFRGGEIDDVTVLVRAPRDMNLIQVSCLLRPLDLLHLSGHFGIPKVDPDAVMVPAQPGR